MIRQKNPASFSRDVYEQKEITNISFHGNHFSSHVYVASFLGRIESVSDCRDTQGGSIGFRSMNTIHHPCECSEFTATASDAL